MFDLGPSFLRHGLDKHINLPQLRDNLLGLVSLIRHSWSSVC
jgi:hypothetical protein